MSTNGKATTIAIKVTRYQDPNGNPTCSIGHTDGNAPCMFLRAGRFGLYRFCAVGEGKELRHGDWHGKPGRGYLIPDEKCPLWPNRQSERQG